MKNSIKEQRESIQARLNDVSDELFDLQDRCPHDNKLTITSLVNVDYDSTAWYRDNYKCTDCGKQWYGETYK